MAAHDQVEAIQESTIEIDAPPELVYALISDVTRTGEWSPECYRCEWLEGWDGPEVGARFRGYNRYRWLKWSRLNEVVVADPGREFAFKVLTDWMNKDSSIWRYQLEERDGRTVLTERTEVLVWPGSMVRFLTFLARRPMDMTDNISDSLVKIKRMAESSPTSRTDAQEPASVQPVSR